MNELQGELDRLERLLVEVIALANPASNKVGTSTVTINAGGTGVWIAVTCCIVSFVMNIALAVAVLDHSRQLDRLEDFVTATYMMAPELQKKAEKPH